MTKQKRRCLAPILIIGGFLVFMLATIILGRLDYQPRRKCTIETRLPIVNSIGSSFLAVYVERLGCIVIIDKDLYIDIAASHQKNMLQVFDMDSTVQNGFGPAVPIDTVSLQPLYRFGKLDYVSSPGQRFSTIDPPSNSYIEEFHDSGYINIRTSRGLKRVIPKVKNPFDPLNVEYFYVYSEKLALRDSRGVPYAELVRY